MVKVNTYLASVFLSYQANNLYRAWSPPLSSLVCLDDVYGASHGLMDFESDSDLSGGGGGGLGGFGLFDGIWKDSGWKVIKDLQVQLREMVELRELMKLLGRRPSVEGLELKKIPPQREGLYAGVYRSRFLPNEATSVKKSSSIEGILPQDAMLLAAGSAASSRLLRLLFMSKIAGGQLSSYELSGYDEMNSTPKKKPWRHFERTPVKSGGPIIVCLDTSWSMAGPRERLAKAVVLECAHLAAKQSRALIVLAFSGSNNLQEYEVDTSATREGLSNLLKFLGSSFSGGTDVTGPLLRAMELIESSQDWAFADVVLVTDGELQTPPCTFWRRSDGLNQIEILRFMD
jgi:uncharacterized protein with von Willebrand factor type A (vWA) domain